MILDLERPDGESFKTTGFPATLSKSGGEVRHSPPALGQDTRAVLLERGYTDEKVDELVENDVIAVDADDTAE